MVVGSSNLRHAPDLSPHIPRRCSRFPWPAIAVQEAGGCGGSICGRPVGCSIVNHGLYDRCFGHGSNVSRLSSVEFGSGSIRSDASACCRRIYDHWVDLFMDVWWFIVGLSRLGHGWGFRSCCSRMHLRLPMVVVAFILGIRVRPSAPLVVPILLQGPSYVAGWRHVHSA